MLHQDCLGMQARCHSVVTDILMPQLAIKSNALLYDGLALTWADTGWSLSDAHVVNMQGIDTTRSILELRTRAWLPPLQQQPE